MAIRNLEGVGFRGVGFGSWVSGVDFGGSIDLGRRLIFMHL